MSDEQSDKPKSRITVSKVLTMALAAQGLLSVIDQFSPLVLYGYLQKWTASYNFLIDSLMGFLFGWIHLWWIELDTNEGRLLFLYAMLYAAYSRAIDVTVHKRDSHSPDAFLSMLGAGAMLLPNVILLLLLPDPYGLIIGSLLLVSVVFIAVWDPFSTPADPLTKMVRQEVKVIFGMVAAAIIVNYALFMQSSAP